MQSAANQHAHNHQDYCNLVDFVRLAVSAAKAWSIEGVAHDSRCHLHTCA